MRNSVTAGSEAPGGVPRKRALPGPYSWNGFEELLGSLAGR
jgi:hypothetical protein